MSDSQLKEEDTEFKEAFALFDKDAKGVVTKSEFKSMLRTLKDPAEVQILEMLEKVEGDNDGNSINFEQFFNMIMQEIENPNTKEEIEESFKVFDKAGKGLISAAELRHSLTTVGEELADDEVDEMILEPDIDKDGNVNYKDIVNMMTQ